MKGCSRKPSGKFLINLVKFRLLKVSVSCVKGTIFVFMEPRYEEKRVQTLVPVRGLPTSLIIWRQEYVTLFTALLRAVNNVPDTHLHIIKDIGSPRTGTNVCTRFSS